MCVKYELENFNYQRIHYGGERLAQRKSKAMPMRELKEKCKNEELKGIKKCRTH
jgi:hypothetical protein